MEELPVELVGLILSRIADARGVVLASAACRKWRQAFREHLRALSFLYGGDRPGSLFLSASEIENLTTRTIFRTTGLQSLAIEIEGFAFGQLSSSSVESWLIHTRDSLRELQFSARQFEALNVIGILGRVGGKLEKLPLARDMIEGVDPHFHRFASLRSLSLRDVFISGLDFTALLASCPLLESLELVFTGYGYSGVIFYEDELPCHLRIVKAPNLRRFDLRGISPDDLILELELDSIEHLELKGCRLNTFKLIGKGTLKWFTLDDVALSHLELCDATQNLEAIEIIRKMIPMSEFYSLVSKSPKLRTLCLSLEEQLVEAIDLDIIARSCPHLTHLSLSCILEGNDEMLPYCLQRSTRFEDLVLLDIGFSDSLMDGFLGFVMGFLEQCPSLEKLVIRVYHEDTQVLSHFVNCIIRITRKYIDLDVQVVIHSREEKDLGV